MARCPPVGYVSIAFGRVCSLRPEKRGGQPALLRKVCPPFPSRTRSTVPDHFPRRRNPRTRQQATRSIEGTRQVSSVSAHEGRGEVPQAVEVLVLRHSQPKRQAEAHEGIHRPEGNGNARPRKVETR